MVGQSHEAGGRVLGLEAFVFICDTAVIVLLATRYTYVSRQSRGAFIVGERLQLLQFAHLTSAADVLYRSCE